VVPERKELKVLLEDKDFRVPKGVKAFKDNKEISVPQDPEDPKDPRDLRAVLKVHREPQQEALPVPQELKEQQGHKELRDLRVHRMLDSRKT
jgi:hypothetical protein